MYTIHIRLSALLLTGTAVDLDESLSAYRF